MAEEMEGGVLVNPASNFSKEMRKWEMFNTPHCGAKGPGKPYKFRPFPQMVFIARPFNGKLRCMAGSPHPYDIKDPEEFRFAQAAAERFTEECQRIVADEQELQAAFEAGYREDSHEALEFAEQREANIARAAAERTYTDRNMSPKAKQAIANIEAQADGKHLAEIPETPLPPKPGVKQCKGEYNKPCSNEAPKAYDFCDAHGRLRPVGSPGSPQCEGTTAKNKRCSRRAREGFKGCGKHPKAG